MIDRIQIEDIEMKLDNFNTCSLKYKNIDLFKSKTVQYKQKTAANTLAVPYRKLSRDKSRDNHANNHVIIRVINRVEITNVLCRDISREESRDV